MKRALVGILSVAGIVCLAAAVFVMQKREPVPSGKASGGNGEIIVEVLSGGEWHEAGAVAFDRFLRGRSIDLDRFGPVERVRLTRRGGGMAHIDRIALGGAGPVWNSEGSDKLQAADKDVVEIAGTLEAAFAPASGALEMVARIEAEVISKIAFSFPNVNTGRSPENYGTFFKYETGSREGRLTVDGELAGEELGKPFFVDSQAVGSGHPQGRTYGWVTDDGERLYVAMDFTPDNTVDGGLDYAKVIARTPEGNRVFRVSMADREWGAPGFTYTDKVGYQHMVYEFEIPLSELGISKGATLHLAFAAYGTAAPAATDSGRGLAYAPASGRYLSAYRDIVDDGLFRQMYDPKGALVGEPLEFGENSARPDAEVWGPASCWGGDIFLVAWQERYLGSEYRIVGRFFDGNGAPDGDIFTIAGPYSSWVDKPSIAYNSDAGEFLVAWSTDGEVWTAPVSEAGIVGSSLSITETGYNPAAVYGAGKYLLVYQNSGAVGQLITAANEADGDAFSVADCWTQVLSFDGGEGVWVAALVDGSDI